MSLADLYDATMRAWPAARARTTPLELTTAMAVSALCQLAVALLPGAPVTVAFSVSRMPTARVSCFGETVTSSVVLDREERGETASVGLVMVSPEQPAEARIPDAAITANMTMRGKCMRHSSGPFGGPTGMAASHQWRTAVAS